MGEFFAMGDYGAYVWSAYGITLFGLAALFVWSWLGARSREGELEQTRKWARAERRAPSTAHLSAALPGAADAGDSVRIDNASDSMPAADASSGGGA